MPEDKRQNEIIRIQKKRNNFVMLDKGFLEDNRLSYKAKGILAYLLSKPDNWKVIIKDLINHSKDGKKAIYSGLKELKECGYYKKIPVRDDSGKRISHWESVIFESPEEDSLFTQKGEVDETRSEPLLPPFVYIENVDIQNEDIQNGERNNNYTNNINFNDNKSKSSQSQTKTIDIDNPTQQELPQKEKEPENRQAEQANDFQSSLLNKHNTNDEYNTYLVILRENIDYFSLLQTYPQENRLIDELLNTMLDVILTKGDTVKINGEEKNRNLVKSQYMKLNYSDIEHILMKFKEQHNRIIHINAYLRTMLYTVKQEHGHYYTNAVRADGIVW